MGNDPREPDFEQANNQLSEGLKSCRAVVNNYRAMLAGDQGENTETDPAPLPNERESAGDGDKAEEPAA